MTELPTPLAVVCHDAGAANLILAWLGQRPLSLRPYFAGPARMLWQATFPTTPLLDSLDQALDGAAALLSGTGWASDLEHQARRSARARGIFSVAVIDHWVNYPQRFSRAGEVVFPDEFWLCDDDALRLAAEHFPAAKLRLQPNLYLTQQVARIPPPTDADSVLYVLEPARSTWGRDVAGEFQALDYFLNHRAALGLPLTATLRLRPHPADPPGKYDSFVAQHPGLLLDDSADLAAAIGGCGWVVGCESFALVVALHAGRRVVCTLPPWAPPCRLPHSRLIHLKELLRP